MNKEAYLKVMKKPNAEVAHATKEIIPDTLRIGTCTYEYFIQDNRTIIGNGKFILREIEQRAPIEQITI